MIKYWKQWRAWVRHKEDEREKELLNTVAKLIESIPNDVLVMAQVIIDYIRDQPKPW